MTALEERVVAALELVARALWAIGGALWTVGATAWRAGSTIDDVLGKASTKTNELGDRLLDWTER